MREPVRRLASSDGTIEAEVLPEVGARLHRLRAFGVDLLRTPADAARHRADPILWGAYPMAPWCNRLGAGSVRVGRRVVTVEPNFRDGTAIHGQVFAATWRESADGAFAVAGGGDWWPWPYAVTQEIGFATATLRIALRLTNLADDPMPAGLGHHPWFVRPVEVAIGAAAVHPTNLEHRAAAEPVAGRFDLRALGDLPIGLDATWTDLGEPPIELHWPAHGLRATLTFDAPSRCVAVASAADVDAVAVEPQTHAPFGLRRLLAGEPDPLRLLDPGASLALSIELRFDQADGSTRSVARNV
jgi:aldose 1-epimerase